MEHMILKANTLNHPWDYFLSRMKSADHEGHGFGHPNHWASHCKRCDVHLETHWVHVVGATPSSQKGVVCWFGRFKFEFQHKIKKR